MNSFMRQSFIQQALFTSYSVGRCKFQKGGQKYRFSFTPADTSPQARLRMAFLAFLAFLSPSIRTPPYLIQYISTTVRKDLSLFEKL